MGGIEGKERGRSPPNNKPKPEKGPSGNVAAQSARPKAREGEQCEQRYNIKGLNPKLSEEAIWNTQRHANEEEVRTVVFEMGSFKALDRMVIMHTSSRKTRKW